MATTNGPRRVHPSKMMQLVDYEENFNDQVEHYLDESGITSLGFDYHVVSIMGPQSSGKSTLLNLLFGTEFRTMDQQQGRYQVTQGVWIGHDDKEEMIVLDLEGTDSRERGEDATTFERKSSLFALAMSEVLIVNLWTNDIGRYNAANLALLKTVLEVDLQLFFAGSTEEDFGNGDVDGVGEVDGEGKRGGRRDRQRFYKTRLLFVLRDHVETPLDELKKILRTDVDNIWKAIDKPEGATNAKVDDFFDIDFFAFPHKLLMKEKFYQAGQVLKDKFYSGEVFKPEYSRMITADGFSTYAESVWNTIRDNKELDIPSQKEMVATVRCEQIARDALDKFDPELEKMRQELAIKDGVATESEPRLIPCLHLAMAKACSEYDRNVHRYSESIAKLKRDDLVANMMNQSRELVTAQLALASRTSIQLVKRSINEACTAREPWTNFQEKTVKWTKQGEETFDNLCSDGKDAQQDGVTDRRIDFSEMVSSARGKLKQNVEELVENARLEILQKAKAQCRKRFRDSIETSTENALDKGLVDEVWDNVATANQVVWDDVKRTVAKVIGTSGLDVDDVEKCGRIMAEVREECYGEALGCIKSLIGRENAFQLRVMKRFNDAFRFDERGVPRVFGPNDDVEALFVKAKEEALRAVDTWGVVQGGLGVFEDRDPVVLFDQSARSTMKEDVSRQAAAVFMEAKRSQEASKVTSKIPLWFIVLLMVLGFDEMVMVLKNPLLLLLAIVVLPLLYIGYSTQAQAYVVPMVTNAARPALIKVRQTLDEYLPVNEGGAAPASAVSNSTPGSSVTQLSAALKGEKPEALKED